MTDCTKIRPKLVYSQKLGYITESTLSSNEITISNIDEIHPKIKYIYEKNAIATQVRVIVLKVFFKIFLLVISSIFIFILIFIKLDSDWKNTSNANCYFTYKR